MIFTFPIQLFPSMELLEASFFFRERKRRKKAPGERRKMELNCDGRPT